MALRTLRRRRLGGLLSVVHILVVLVARIAACARRRYSSCQSGHCQAARGLTIHSSRSRFAARLNSGVRPLKALRVVAAPQFALPRFAHHLLLRPAFARALLVSQGGAQKILAALSLLKRPVAFGVGAQALPRRNRPASPRLKCQACGPLTVTGTLAA